MKNASKMKSVGIIGLGKMGEAILTGLGQANKSDPVKIMCTTRSQESADEASSRLKIQCSTDNRALVRDSDVLILCVKPHQAEEVLNSIADQLTANHLIISICASITTQQLRKWSGKKAAIVRAMPNTPCLIGEGMTVFCSSPDTEKQHLELVAKVFGTLGRTAQIEESLMDGATGLSGCGPAYVYLIIEALSEAGVKVGLPRQVATTLAAQTLLGASKMVLERGIHPAQLKDEVTTPAGCTIDGLMALEEGKLRVTLIKAVLAAEKKSRKLGQKK